MKKIWQGIGASGGIAIAPAYLLTQPVFDLNQLPFESVDHSFEIYSAAKAKSIAQMEHIIKVAEKKLSADKVEVFRAHIMLVNDEAVESKINELLNQSIPVPIAVEKAYNEFFDIFSNMEDEYFKERAADIADVKRRILANLLSVPLPDLLNINEPCIIVAHDLTPSETAQLDTRYVKGFLTNIGGKTSHAAIMARSLGIPAVLSLKTITTDVVGQPKLAMDGSSGEVVLLDSAELEQVWATKLEHNKLLREELAKYRHVTPTTTDGHTVVVEGNIGSDAELDAVLEYGAHGIGLFRSEFLYMENSNWPTEQEQLRSYQAVLAKIPDQLVIIRTLDIGGDKHLDYYQFPSEMNPFLGYRALRLCLDQKQILITQLRALLRASVHGKLGIMFPMVATVDELLAAKEILRQTQAQLDQENIPYSKNVLVGMMIEIPTAAVLASTFAKYVDFFSIGSNDLIQYSMAVDRMSEKVSYLYQPNFPGLLRMIQLAIMGAHSHKVPIGMCGEMASELKSVPLLLGLGLDGFSMSGSSIPAVKRLISKLSYQDCQTLAQKALTLNNEVEVNALVDQFLAERNIKL